MIWRWVWRTVALFLGRRVWAAWQRRRGPAYATAPSAPTAPRRSARRR